MAPISSAWRKADAAGVAYPSLLTGASQVAFAALPFGAINERVIANPSLTAYIYVDLVGDTAVANGAGTVPIAPLQSFFTESPAAMTVIGTAGQPITVRER